MKDVQVKAGELKNLEHNFKTGIAMIGAKGAGGLVDAGVNIKDNKTKQSIINRRTYTSQSSNPKEFILNPGVYEVTITAFGSYNGKKQTITITVKEGETVEKMITF